MAPAGRQHALGPAHAPRGCRAAADAAVRALASCAAACCWLKWSSIMVSTSEMVARPGASIHSQSQ
eukprot:7672044-Pyramimonas_sp.AAC.1